MNLTVNISPSVRCICNLLGITFGHGASAAEIGDARISAQKNISNDGKVQIH